MIDGIERMFKGLIPGYSLLALFGSTGKVPPEKMREWCQEDPPGDKLITIKEVYDIGVGHAVVYDGIAPGIGYLVFDRARGCFNSTTPQRKFDGVEVKRDPVVTRQALTYLRQEASSRKTLYDLCRMPDPAVDEFINELDKRLAEFEVGGGEPQTPGTGIR